MKMNRRYPLVRLPESVDLTLFLIREELKSTHFFNGLQRLGLSDCFYQTHLGSAILSQIGFTNCPDDLFAFYTDLLDKHCELPDEDMNALTTQALAVYRQLLEEKSRRQAEST